MNMNDLTMDGTAVKKCVDIDNHRITKIYRNLSSIDFLGNDNSTTIEAPGDQKEQQLQLA